MRCSWVLLLLTAAVAAQEETVGDYGRNLEDAITELRDGRYAHKDDASRARVLESVRGFGRAEWETSDHLVYLVDRLLFVLAHDPTPALRAAACEELGRVLGRLPPGDRELIRRFDAGRFSQDDARINELAGDLIRSAVKQPEEGRVATSLRELAGLTPPTMLSARQLVRAFASRPAADSDSPAVREVRGKAARGVVWKCIVVSLLEARQGGPEVEYPRDSSPEVRDAAGRPIVAALLGVDAGDRSRLIDAALAQRGDLMPRLDRVLFVLAHDPVPGVRIAMCQELGRMLTALPEGEAWHDPAVGRGGWGMTEELAATRIDRLVGDLERLRGPEATGVEVASRVRQLARTSPPDLGSVRRVTHAFSAPPVSGSGSVTVALAREQAAPEISRLCVIVALEQIAGGRGKAKPDPDAEVRQAAVEALGPAAKAGD